MEINNFDLIADQLSFNNRDEFYFLQIIQRKKDKGNEGLHVRSGYRLIRSYYIYSKQELLDLKGRIIELCKNNNARAYISLNVKNAKEVALECIKKYTDLVRNNNAFMGNNVWDSACGSTKARGSQSLWIVDIDDMSILDSVVEIVNSCQGHDPRIKCIVPTVNGCHLITYGFNSLEFREKLNKAGLGPIDIHKNNPTLLYYDLSGKSE